MYAVVWDDWAGQRNEMTFRTYSEACLEADCLAEKYDFVDVEVRQ